MVVIVLKHADKAHKSSRSFCTSAANTASAEAVESMQLALMEITQCPPSFRKYFAFRPTMRAWSGCATSAKIVSTIGTRMRYFSGCRASSMIGTMFVRVFATFSRSRPGRCENSTAYTAPSCH